MTAVLFWLLLVYLAGVGVAAVRFAWWIRPANAAELLLVADLAARWPVLLIERWANRRGKGFTTVGRTKR